MVSPNFANTTKHETRRLKNDKQMKKNVIFGHHLDEKGYCAHHVETNHYVEQATGQKYYAF